jgi:hypothetical protein
VQFSQFLLPFAHRSERRGFPTDADASVEILRSISCFSLNFINAEHVIWKEKKAPFSPCAPMFCEINPVAVRSQASGLADAAPAGPPKVCRSAVAAGSNVRQDSESKAVWQVIARRSGGVSSGLFCS